MSMSSYRVCVGPFAANNSSQQQGLPQHEARETKQQKPCTFTLASVAQPVHRDASPICIGELR
eukprot:2605845-Pyramimonas_sp.AAC.1